MYQNMGEILKDRQVGEWKLQHFQIKPGDLYAFKNGIAPGNYVRLCDVQYPHGTLDKYEFL